MRRSFLKILLALAVLFTAGQLIPVERSNPPVPAEIAVSRELQAVLRRTCYDCHSNETVWPWYSRIAPVSWLLALDVSEGREHLNFSHWEALGAEKQAKLKKNIRKSVEEGEMPPWYFLPPHPEARLNDRDLALIFAWTGHGQGRD